MRVTALHVYPVKSLGGYAVSDSAVTPQGLEGDRRWAVLDPVGKRVSARDCNAMLRIVATPTPGGLRLTHGEDTLDVATPGPDSPRVETQISRVDSLALADERAGAWLSERLGRDLRLAHQTEARSMSADHGGRPGDTLSLADTGPLLLVTQSSVDRVRELVAETAGEEWVGRDEATQRFRPNVVVDGDEPFAEDEWHRVRIGDAVYRRGELCDRCVLTTIDLTSYVTTKEPIRTLARHRAWDGATWFGVRLVPESGQVGAMAVGDEVEPLT